MKKLLMIAGIFAALSIQALEIGDASPKFSAKDQDGNDWVLADHLSEKPVVVYFYPAAMTGGCTKQACAYRDYVAAGEPAFAVVGISADNPEGLKYFQTSENLNFPLLSDPGGKIAKSFGVDVKEGEKSIKRTVEGKEVELVRSATTMRWTFVISPAGKIIYKSDKVKPTEDLQNVLAAIGE